MLYPRSEITYPSSNGRFDIPSGTLVYLPLTIPQGGSVKLTMAQLIVDPSNYPQDRSIRCWMAKNPGAGAIDPAPHFTWHLSALMHHTVIVYDRDLPRPAGKITVPVPAGNACLSALNLVNETNSFSLVIA